MKTQRLTKNGFGISIILLFTITLVFVFTACENNDNDQISQGAPQEAPVETPRDAAKDSYDDLTELLNSLVEIDANGQITNRYYGEPLDANDATHLYIGVDKLQEAEELFHLWLAPDVTITRNADGSVTASLSDKQGNPQGTLNFAPSKEENNLAEVTTDTKQDVFTRITFLNNKAWPSNKLQSGNRYCKFDIVKDVKLKDIKQWAPAADQQLNFVCIQGSTNGVKPIFAAITNNRYGNPVLKQYIMMMRNSKYCPGTGTAPTAVTIQSILGKDWSAFKQAFEEAGNGQLVEGTEYWFDDTHKFFLWEYNEVMDYHSGYVYGEDKNKNYYFLFRMYGLSDSQIYDGMTF